MKMRLIQFRSWLKKKSEMFYSFSTMRNNRLSEDDEVVVMQYTGLDDKNDKKIFEGDIIKFTWEEDSCWGKAGTYKGYVRFNEGVFEVAYINREKKTKNEDGSWHKNSQADDIQSLFNWSKDIEVIGNIYENPICWRISNDFE